jgi:hypothetical protein
MKVIVFSAGVDDEGGAGELEERLGSGRLSGSTGSYDDHRSRIVVPEDVGESRDRELMAIDGTQQERNRSWREVNPLLLANSSSLRTNGRGALMSSRLAVATP